MRRTGGIISSPSLPKVKRFTKKYLKYWKSGEKQSTLKELNLKNWNRLIRFL